MIRSLYIAKTGMDAQQTNLDVISNNLANASTTGYKRGRANFEDLLYQNLRQPGGASSQQTNLPTGLQVGAGARTVGTSKLFTQGNLQQTGDNFDIAINGQGFFGVQMPDGTQAYTRDGSFKVDAQGQSASGFAKSLQRAGYATDPNYASKLTTVINQTVKMSAGVPSF
jgi:flagellar basal-body rod protein FlgG